jgi:hypothetical protein
MGFQAGKGPSVKAKTPPAKATAPDQRPSATYGHDHGTPGAQVGEPPDPQDPARATETSQRRFGSVAVALITAAVALVSSVVALTFELWPSLRPDPRSELGATASVLAVERNVTLGEWMQRVSRTDADLRRRRKSYIASGGSRGGLLIPGQLAYVRTSVRGFKRRDVTLRWSIYDARTQERRREDSWDRANRSGLALGAPRDESVAEIWLPAVVGARKYFVRIEVRDGDGALLAIADSEPFRGL